jgi:hypothetical protein
MGFKFLSAARTIHGHSVAPQLGQNFLCALVTAEPRLIGSEPGNHENDTAVLARLAYSSTSTCVGALLGAELRARLRSRCKRIELAAAMLAGD